MSDNYLMENREEIIRLEQNLVPEELKAQAEWCGLKPGMKVLEIGCGPGKSTSILWETIQPGGEIIGVSYLKNMIEHAKRTYGNRKGINFYLHDFTSPFSDIGEFDLIWVRFVLEYHKNESINILNNLKNLLKPGGLMCLLDLDHNCLNYYPISREMEKLIENIMESLQKKFNFDPYAGRKLYTYLWELGFKDIEVNIRPYHLIYGKIQEHELFNWMKKAEVLSERVPEIFNQYPGGNKGFLKDFKEFLLSKKRFIYTPIIMCKGKKP